MKVNFEKNINVDVMHSLFTITEYNKKTYPPFSFELKCADNKYLCANGWQQNCIPLEIHKFKEHNHTIQLFVDSNIIKYLEEGKIYTFTLNSHEQPPQSTTLTLNEADILPPNNAEFMANSNIDMQNDNAANAPENEAIISSKHYPLVAWFLVIWLSGCLIFGYLMFKDTIDNYFSRTPIKNQDKSNNALPVMAQEPLKNGQGKNIEQSK